LETSGQQAIVSAKNRESLCESAGLMDPQF